MATNKRPFASDWEDFIVDHRDNPPQKRRAVCAISAVIGNPTFPSSDLDYSGFDNPQSIYADGNTGIAFPISPAYSNHTEANTIPSAWHSQISTPLDVPSLINDSPEVEVNNTGVGNKCARRLCFGMVRKVKAFPIRAEAKDTFQQIADAALAPFQKKIKTKDKTKDSEDAKSEDTRWQIRFRSDAVTVLGPDKEELGVLDTRTAKILTELLQIIPSLMFEPFLDQIRSPSKEANRHRLGIIVYGESFLIDQVDSTLSRAGVYLQEPPSFDTSCTYCNPHVLSWEDEEASPTFLSHLTDNTLDFEKEIIAIFDESGATRLSNGLRQDGRIQTQLLP